METSTGAAIAYLRISLDEFNDLTPREFDEAMKAWNKIQTVTLENQVHLTYEAARFIVVQMWNSAGKSLKSDIRDAKEAFPLPWEKEQQTEVGKVQTIDEMKSTVMNIVDFFKNKKGVPQKQKQARR